MMHWRRRQISSKVNSTQKSSYYNKEGTELLIKVRKLVVEEGGGHHPHLLTLLYSIYTI